MSDDFKSRNIPRHIAIIPDGNRRWAKKKGVPPWEGIKYGAKVFEKLLDWCKESGVKEISFWAASTDNLERDKKEVEFIFSLFNKFLEDFIKKQSKGKIKGKARIRFIGDLKRLPLNIQEKMKKVEEATKQYSDYKLNMLVGYGGRWEITEAAKKIAEEVKEGKLKTGNITQETFQKHLMLEDEPDLIIRTSEQRLSGLLPWQGVYSEIIFIKDKHWPDFTEEDFKKCLEEYSNRQRRFGR